MALVFGALAQVAPLATTLTDAYTVPASKRATVEVVICNRGAGAATVRLSHAVGGLADTGKQYLIYDLSVAVAGTYSTARFTMKAGDVLRVYASTADVSFNVNGIEEDA